MRELKRKCPSPQLLTWNVVRVLGGPPRKNGGKGVRVGVIDTGIDLLHRDLAANIRGGINIVDPSSPPQDDNGHGTHVSGIIGARHSRSGVVGIAPAVSLYAIKVMDTRGNGTLDDLLKGIEWGVRHKMNVLNMSINGGTTAPPPLVEAMRTAVKQGVLVIAAAGNAGRPTGTGDTVEAPARLPMVEAVASLNRNNRRTTFSATGTAVNIAAPGADILSAYPRNRYAVLSGTSMASAHVTGVACILIQNRPGASPERIKQMLHNRALPLPPRTRDELNGAGLVQLHKTAPTK